MSGERLDVTVIYDAQHGRRWHGGTPTSLSAFLTGAMDSRFQKAMTAAITSGVEPPSPERAHIRARNCPASATSAPDQVGAVRRGHQASSRLRDHRPYNVQRTRPAKSMIRPRPFLRRTVSDGFGCSFSATYGFNFKPLMVPPLKLSPN